MLLTVSTTHVPATDLGFLLHKNPARPPTVEVSAGTAHVFYPEATEQRCTVALLLEVDPIAPARGSRGTEGLGQYVNDRPYAASSLLAVALGKAFWTVDGSTPWAWRRWSGPRAGSRCGGCTSASSPSWPWSPSRSTSGCSGVRGRGKRAPRTPLTTR